MKQILLLLLLITVQCSAQELSLEKAQMQTINQGAAPVSVTTYTIQLRKNKKFCWSIDSVTSIRTGEKVDYHLVRVNDPAAVSPDYKPVQKFLKSDRGLYQVTFSIRKQRGGSGRPGAPQNTKVDTTNIEGGVTIWYSVKKKKKSLQVMQFDQLETVDAP